VFADPLPGFIGTAISSPPKSCTEVESPSGARGDASARPEVVPGVSRPAVLPGIRRHRESTPDTLALDRASATHLPQNDGSQN
jgi:hypothetical protein